MSGRNHRLKAVKRIIACSRISSQSQLRRRLEAEGYEVTQATLSRDLKLLKVGKVPDAAGHYRYVVPSTDEKAVRSYVEDFRRGYRSMDFSHNIAVVRTLSGHADTVAIALEHLDFPEILGTIAGDDTTLVIVREGISPQILHDRLSEYMGELEVSQ